MEVNHVLITLMVNVSAPIVDGSPLVTLWFTPNGQKTSDGGCYPDESPRAIRICDGLEFSKAATIQIKLKECFDSLGIFSELELQSDD